MELIGTFFSWLLADVLGWKLGIASANARLERKWRSDAESGRYFGALRLRSGVQRGISRHDRRSGAWEVTPNRMRLEEVDLRNVEIVPGTLGVVVEEESFLLGRVETRSLVICTPNAKFDWFLPASISAEAIRALGGAAQKTAAASASAPEGGGS